jgi:hypothetical protein
LKTEQNPLLDTLMSAWQSLAEQSAARKSDGSNPAGHVGQKRQSEEAPEFVDDKDSEDEGANTNSARG